MATDAADRGPALLLGALPPAQIPERVDAVLADHGDGGRARPGDQDRRERARLRGGAPRREGDRAAAERAAALAPPGRRARALPRAGSQARQ